MERSNQLLNEKVVLSMKAVRIASSTLAFSISTINLEFFVNESWDGILNPMYFIPQESLERKINLLENDLSSFCEKEVITCLLSHILLHWIYCLLN